MQLDKTKILIVFVLLFVAIMNVNVVHSASSDSIKKNPYGEGNWELHQGGLTPIIKEGSDLIQGSSKSIAVKISVDEEGKEWSEIKVNLEPRYGQNLSGIDYKSFTFRVKKSNNMAYLKRTGEKIGFCPFYIYKYTDTDFLGDELEKTISLDNKYEVTYLDSKGFHYRHDPTDPDSLMTLRVRDALSFSTKNKKINFYATNYTQQEWTNHKKNVESKGHFPLSFKYYLQPDIFMENSTDEKYIMFTGRIGIQEDAVKFLNSLDIGKDPKERRINWPLIAVIGGTISFGASVGYISYRKRK